MATIAERLRAAIEKSPIPQAELGRRLHKSRSAISGWKTGRSEPDLATFAKLCRETGKSADELLGLTDERPSRHQLDETIKRLGEALALLAGGSRLALEFAVEVPEAEEAPIRQERRGG